MGRNVDIVFCIDGTGSMAPFMKSVKERAASLGERLRRTAKAKGIEIDGVRVKFILFRDYASDNFPMQISSWYELGIDDKFYLEFVNALRPYGGGDLPENGLEALWYAMRSDFLQGDGNCQIILLISDADALAMEERCSHPNYPVDIGNYSDLISLWNGALRLPDITLSQSGKRLILLAPPNSRYHDLISVFDASTFHPITLGRGGVDISFAEIMKIVVSSIGGR